MSKPDLGLQVEEGQRRIQEYSNRKVCHICSIKLNTNKDNCPQCGNPLVQDRFHGKNRENFKKQNNAFFEDLKKEKQRLAYRPDSRFGYQPPKLTEDLEGFEVQKARKPRGRKII